jgi:hypothetical protein
MIKLQKLLEWAQYQKDHIYDGSNPYSGEWEMDSAKENTKINLLDDFIYEIRELMKE